MENSNCKACSCNLFSPFADEQSFYFDAQKFNMWFVWCRILKDDIQQEAGTRHRDVTPHLWKWDNVWHVVHPICRSVNYNRLQQICELLGVTLNWARGFGGGLRHNLVEAIGWNHLDTGHKIVVNIYLYFFFPWTFIYVIARYGVQYGIYFNEYSILYDVLRAILSLEWKKNKKRM